MPAEKRNILVIWGDDIGMWNVGAYTHGMMGHTPNIDSIAKDGCIFTDHYGHPRCTAGRAAFITGQLPVRTDQQQLMLNAAFNFSLAMMRNTQLINQGDA